MQTRTVSVGPNATTPADSQWLRLDEWAGGQVCFQCVVTGTVVYNVETTNDDPNDPINPVASPTWDSTLTGITGSAQNTYNTIIGVPRYIKVNLTSGTGSVTMTVTQTLGAPF